MVAVLWGQSTEGQSPAARVGGKDTDAGGRGAGGWIGPGACAAGLTTGRPAGARDADAGPGRRGRSARSLTSPRRTGLPGEAR